MRTLIAVLLVIALFLGITGTAIAARGGNGNGQGQPTEKAHEPRPSHDGTPDPCPTRGGCGPGDHGQGDPSNGSDHANENAWRGEVDPVKTPTTVPTDVPTTVPTERPTELPTPTPTITPTPTEHSVYEYETGKLCCHAVDGYVCELFPGASWALYAQGKLSIPALETTMLAESREDICIDAQPGEVVGFYWPSHAGEQSTHVHVMVKAGNTQHIYMPAAITARSSASVGRTMQ